MPFMKRKQDTPQSVIGRVLAILNAFGPDQPSLSLSEISRLTGLPATTTFRLLAQLTEWGALTRSADRRYWIGPRLVDLAMVAPRSRLAS
jgi:DNA-binding IclR family transcriptional regulator